MSYRIMVFLQAFAEHGQVLDVRCLPNCSVLLVVR
jgi:hypothetical protein